jgi:4'-phosphopantetheinyl transferase
MTVDPRWVAPPVPLTLSREEVHVWRASLRPSASRVFCLRDTLAPDELERAEQYVFRRDRERYILGRGILRAILSRYLGVKPAELSFSYNCCGKPSLAAPFHRNGFQFNVSHSDWLALYGVARGRKIGVDLERVNSDLDCEEIARHFFSKGEIAALCTLPEQSKHKGFYNCWTRKEAYVKAKGAGFSIPLDEFDVTLIPGVPARLLHTEWEPQEVTRWSFEELRPGRGYAAAIAVEGRPRHLTCLQWSD